MYLMVIQWNCSIIILLMSTSNLVDLIAQNKQYEFHRRKIENIMSKSSQSLSFRKKDPFASFHSSKDRSRRFNDKMKQQAVDKQNDLMLKKIIDVNRRSESISVPTPAEKRNLSHNNLSTLRKKLEKTNEENQKLANKLVLATSKLSQNLLNENYRRHAEIKERLKKYTFDEETGMVVTKKIKSLVRMNRVESLREEVYASRVDNIE